MLGTPPPQGPTTNAMTSQTNQLLGQPGNSATALPSRPPTGSMFPGVGGAVSQSPLLQQSNNQINAMVASLMGKRGM